MLAELTRRFERERIDWRMSWALPDAARPVRIASDRYPIIWECPSAVAGAMKANRPALLLNDRPPAGLDSIFIDSVSVDDFAGGACAAQILQRHRVGDARTPAEPLRTAEPRDASFAILSGPADDPRSIARVAGFRSIARATAKASADWFYDGGMARAKEVLAAGRDGIFCCNDRLAEAVVRYCRARDLALPPVVGFDDAPVAEELGLTTIAIPWTEVGSAVVAVATRRLSGATATAIAQLIATRPVIRHTANPSHGDNRDQRG
jgi:DNA-binding LacI/PurR family transcriptional regulator